MSRVKNPYRIVDRGPNTDPERRFAIYRRADGRSVAYWPTYAAAHQDVGALRCGDALLALEASGFPIHDFSDGYDDIFDDPEREAHDAFVDSLREDAEAEERRACHEASL